MPKNQKLKIFGALLVATALGITSINLPPVQVSAQEANLSMTLCRTVVGADTFVDATINIRSTTGDYILGGGSIGLTHNYTNLQASQELAAAPGIKFPEVLKDSSGTPVSEFDSPGGSPYQSSRIDPLDVDWYSYETHNVTTGAATVSGTTVNSTSKKYGGFRLKALDVSKNHGIKFRAGTGFSVIISLSGAAKSTIVPTSSDPTDGPISALPICGATTLGTPTGTGGLTGTVGSTVGGTIPLTGATYTGPAEYRNTNGPGACVIPGNVSGSVFTPASGFVIPAGCPTGPLTNGSLVTTPTSGFTPDPINNGVPSNFTPGIRDLTVDDLKTSNLACNSVPAGSVTTCTFTLPSGTRLPSSGLTLAGGSTTPGGTCTLNSGSATQVTCTSVPTQTTADPAAPIMASIGGSTPQDTTKDINLTGSTTPTLGTVSSGALTGTVGTTVGGSITLSGATYSGPATFSNGSGCSIVGNIAGGVFNPTPVSIPLSCPTGSLTNGTLTANPISGLTPAPINNAPSNFSPASSNQLTIDDLRSSDLTCLSVNAGTPTNCNFTMPSGKVLPAGGLYLGGGNVTTGGSCSEMMGLVFCVNVPTQTTADPAAPIMASFGSVGAGQDTNKDVNLTSPSTSTTLGTPTGTGGLTGNIGSPVSGTVPLTGATYTGPAEYRNTNGSGACVIPGNVSGSVFTPTSGFVIPAGCPTGPLTNGSLVATPTTGTAPAPINNGVPSNFSSLPPLCTSSPFACAPIRDSNLSCTPTIAGQTTTCNFNISGYVIPNDLQVAVGNGVSPAGTCIVSGSTVFCTGVPTQTTPGTGVPIFVSRPGQTPYNTTKTTDLYSSATGGACTPSVPCFLFDTKYSFNPVAGASVYGTQDAVLTINPGILTGTPNSGNKYVCKVSIKMAGKADNDSLYGYAALTQKLSGGTMFGTGVDTAKIMDYNNTTGNCSFTLPRGEQSARYYDYRIIVAEVDGSNNNVRQVFQAQPGYYMKLGSLPIISVYP